MNLTRISLCLLAAAVLAPAVFSQSVAYDTRPRPGSPKTGWSGNFSSTEPYSAGPQMGAWITKAGMIHSRSEITVGAVNGKMYVLGGYADGNVAQTLNEEYDPDTDMWYERAPLPRGGNHIAAVGLDGKLYAIGGFSEQNANAFADVSAYDPQTDKWVHKAPLPQPLGSMAVDRVTVHLKIPMPAVYIAITDPTCSLAIEFEFEPIAFTFFLARFSSESILNRPRVA
jgi:Kelch motif